MTKLLEQALAELSKLSESDQDSMAAWLLEEIESDRRWDKALSESHKSLARMADEAFAEHSDGRTQELDPDRM